MQPLSWTQLPPLVTALLPPLFLVGRRSVGGLGYQLLLHGLGQLLDLVHQLADVGVLGLRHSLRLGLLFLHLGSDGLVWSSRSASLLAAMPLRYERISAVTASRVGVDGGLVLGAGGGAAGVLLPLLELGGLVLEVRLGLVPRFPVGRPLLPVLHCHAVELDGGVDLLQVVLELGGIGDVDAERLQPLLVGVEALAEHGDVLRRGVPGGIVRVLGLLAGGGVEDAPLGVEVLEVCADGDALVAHDLLVELLVVRLVEGVAEVGGDALANAEERGEALLADGEPGGPPVGRTAVGSYTGGTASLT